MAEQSDINSESNSFSEIVDSEKHNSKIIDSNRLENNYFTVKEDSQCITNNDETFSQGILLNDGSTDASMHSAAPVICFCNEELTVAEKDIFLNKISEVDKPTSSSLDFEESDKIGLPFSNLNSCSITSSTSINRAHVSINKYNKKEKKNFKMFKFNGQTRPNYFLAIKVSNPDVSILYINICFKFFIKKKLNIFFIKK